MKSIFINYRREDSAGEAGRIFDRLRTRFDAERIFMDVSGSIAPGQSFPDAIGAALESSGVFLAIVGPRWLELKDDDTGKRRLDQAEDWVRTEIEAALSRGLPLIPVLVDGAQMPSADELPEPLRALTDRNAISLSDTRWDYDSKKLVSAVEAALGERPPVLAGAFRKGLIAAALFAVVLSSLWWVSRGRSPADDDLIANLTVNNTGDGAEAEVDCQQGGMFFAAQLINNTQRSVQVENATISFTPTGDSPCGPRVFEGQRNPHHFTERTVAAGASQALFNPTVDLAGLLCREQDQTSGCASSSTEWTAHLRVDTTAAQQDPEDTLILRFRGGGSNTAPGQESNDH